MLMVRRMKPKVLVQGAPPIGIQSMQDAVCPGANVPLGNAENLTRQCNARDTTGDTAFDHVDHHHVHPGLARNGEQQQQRCRSAPPVVGQRQDQSRPVAGPCNLRVSKRELACVRVCK